MYILSVDGTPLSEQCPYCLTEGSYRINVNFPKNNLLMFCISCRNNHSFVPLLNKYVIYLDQLHISNIANVKRGKDINYNNEYKILDAKCLSLMKQQLVVFPTSNFHLEETSYISENYQKNAIQSVAESLDCETRFKDINSIIEEGMLARLANRKLSVDEILYGERNAFYGAKGFRVSLAPLYKDGIFREFISQKITELLKREKQSFDGILSELVSDYKDIVNFFVKKIFEDNNSDLESALKESVVLRLIAALLLEISYAYSKVGRKKDVGTGMASDICMIASILPFVDAIFLDKEMHNFINQSKNILNENKIKVYSLNGVNGKKNSKKNDFESFISFLNTISSKAPHHSYPPFEFSHTQLIEAYYRGLSSLC